MIRLNLSENFGRLKEIDWGKIYDKTRNQRRFNRSKKKDTGTRRSGFARMPKLP